ncbi:MAG: nucleotide sugar dehydrogenase [Acidimicrobiales bacterium]
MNPNHSTDRRLLVVGQGYVGLPLTMRAVDVGYLVVGFDTDKVRIQRLSEGDSYVEDVAPLTVQTALGSGRYRPTADPDDCAGFDVAVICVPTPLLEGAPDLSTVVEAGRTVGSLLRPGCTVVLESTTYPGTTTELLLPILEDASGLCAGEDFYLGYSPERIDPGNPRWNVANTPKVVSGIDPASLAAVRQFYDTLVEKTVVVSGTKEAELAKLLENTFRHVNIALVNELAIFATGLGIDIWEVVEAAASKPFGFMSFTPGPGVGGHCLPIDPSYLAWRVERQLGRPFRFVALAKEINDEMPAYVVNRLMVGLNGRKKPVNGSRILLLGLAYKRDTGDARESPAVAVARQLVDLGAQVRAADPHVYPGFLMSGVTMVELSPEEVAHADAVVVLTDHSAFDPDVVAGGDYVLDTRNWLGQSGPHIERL